jgi:hypothetical protein
VALAPLTCAPLGPCDVATFDADAGACTHAVARDGTSCPDPTLCLANPVCAQGSCVGTPKDCNDDNACTQDYCVSGTGCQHQDISATCQGNAPCQVYGCDPASGCTQSNAPNGTACSLNNNCQTAEICILGNCTGVAVPDGTPCTLWWEPCVDAGCQGGVCHDAVAEAEVPGQLRWDAGLPGAYGPIAVDDAGTSYFFSFDYGAELADGSYNSSLVAFSACGQQLWSAPMSWLENAIIDDDQLIVTTWNAATDGTLVAGLDRATGAPLWTLDPGVVLAGKSDAEFVVGTALTGGGLLCTS